MAKVHGVAGEWARVKGALYGLWPIFIGVFVAGFSLAMAVFFSPWLGCVCLTLAAVGIAWSVSRGLRRVESFYVGARGEERVSSILKQLPDEYHVFNDFLANGEHVDHVVVGPSGVYAVETKFWRGAVTIEDGQVLVNGSMPSRSPLKQVRREAELVRIELSHQGWNGPVTPIVAFASDTFTAKYAEVAGTIVINSSELQNSFSGSRRVLEVDELDRLVTLIKNR